LEEGDNATGGGGGEGPEKKGETVGKKRRNVTRREGKRLLLYGTSKINGSKGMEAQRRRGGGGGRPHRPRVPKKIHLVGPISQEHKNNGLGVK